MKAELVLENLKRERDALDNRLERLAAALDKEWQDEDQEYLCTQQYNAMSLYAHILDERIIDIECKLKQRKDKSKATDVHETSHCKEGVSCENPKGNISQEENECDCDINNLKVIIGIIDDIFGIDNLIK